MVGLGRLELPTSRLSGVRSNRLSYRPGIERPVIEPGGDARRPAAMPEEEPPEDHVAKSRPDHDETARALTPDVWKRKGCEGGAEPRRRCKTPRDHRTSRRPASGSLKGGDPAAGSPTATLLRLHPSRGPDRGRLPPLRVGAPASGRTNSHGVTGGVYKARERIHRGVLIRDY